MKTTTPMMPHCWLLQGQVSWNTDDQVGGKIRLMLRSSPTGNPSSVRCAAELPEPSGLQPAEVSACCSAARRPVDGSLWSCEQTLDDSCVLHTSPNVGSASKWICFQSLLPFSALVPRLKYIMARLMMKGWFCSSGRGGEMKEGLRRLSAALRGDHYGEERGCRSSFTHVPFSFNCERKWLKTHSHILQLFNNTNTFTPHADSWLFPVLKRRSCRFPHQNETTTRVLMNVKSLGLYRLLQNWHHAAVNLEFSVQRFIACCTLTHLSVEFWILKNENNKNTKKTAAEFYIRSF